MAKREPELHVLFAVFDRGIEAGQAMKGLKEMAENGSIELKDAAAVRCDPNRKVRVTHIGDLPGGKAIVGGLLAMIFPASVLVGDAVDTVAAGGLTGRLRAEGFDRQDLKKAGEELQPGQSALIAVVGSRDVDRTMWGVQGYTKLDEYRLNIDTGAVVAV
jgi:uncharacterized membrane protein